MIHYYEHVRLENVEDTKKGSEKAPAQSGTRHIAPVTNTPLTNNVKPKIQADVNSINNDLDKLKPQSNPNIPAGYTVAKAKTEETKVVEKINVAEEIKVVEEKKETISEPEQEPNSHVEDIAPLVINPKVASEIDLGFTTEEADSLNVRLNEN